jgi:predicted SprT family Zn-dependent metalloprotease
MEFNEENRYTEGEKFKVTVEWMKDRYEKANRELFRGRLGECYFEAKPTRPNNLGNFRMDVRPGELAYCKTDRRMFKKGANYDPYAWGSYEGKIYVNKDNFFEFCRPTIKMNTMYTGTENSLYNTLVHEMCHYYTYMDGYVPVQAHGRDFRNIAMIVSERSNGAFTIQRLASAEEMEGYQLDNDVKVRTRKHNTPHYYLEFLNDGSDKVKLSNLNSTGFRTMMTYIARHQENTVIELKNEEIANKLYDEGYRQQSRNYSYWTLYRGGEIVTEILMDNDNYSLVWQGK